MNKIISLVIWLFLNSQFLNCFHNQDIYSAQQSSYQKDKQIHLSVLSEITGIFNDLNPNVDEVLILDVCPKQGEFECYIVLAHGIRGDRQFYGMLEDELFGVFVVNLSFTEVISILDLIPTPRWNDYTMRFDKPLSDSIILVGQGLSYGDEKLRKAYPWPCLP
ncbi:MAG: hypothetical protein APR63_02935 [Desulfuromonas sp. SDB]|nr:MAG: hypothetical protein APR63_02935 [Desulfuromonas sp. SDB]